MNSLNDTMQALQQLVWNPEKKTIFGKNGVSWCSIGLGTLVIAIVIVIFYQSIRDVKKARRELDSKIKSYPQHLQTSHSADAADASTQQNTYNSNTINPRKQTENDSVRLPSDTLELNFSIGETGAVNEAAGGSMVLKKRAIITEPQNKNILELQASTKEMSPKLLYQNIAAFSALEANDEENTHDINTSQNQLRSANQLRTDILSPPFDGISPLSRQNYSRRQLTTKDINRFIIRPTQTNSHLSVRFVHNSKVQKNKASEFKAAAPRINSNTLSKSDDQNQRFNSKWQASTSYMSARRIKGQGQGTGILGKDQAERIKGQTPKLTMQPSSFKPLTLRNIEPAQIIKRQGPRNYMQFSGIKPLDPNGNENAPRFKEQAPINKSKIPKIEARSPTMEKETTFNPEPPKQKSVSH